MYLVSVMDKIDEDVDAQGHLVNPTIFSCVGLLGPNMQLLTNFAKGATLLLGGIEMYSRAPSILFSPSPLPHTNETSSVHVLFPGFGGPDANTDRIVDSLNKNAGNEVAYVYDWSAFRGNILRAAFNGERVGKRVGRQLAYTPEVTALHCIGVSVGSFAADACIKEFNRLRQNRRSAPISGVTHTKAQTVLTLLCPFQQRGLLGAGYGTKHFGKYAQYAEQYYIADDPVPGCNTPLNQAYCFDVTSAKERDAYVNLPGDSVHAFPVYYYGKAIASQSNKNIWKNDALSHLVDKPRGKIVAVNGKLASDRFEETRNIG